MRHCLMYQGGFERNFSNLKPGSNSFTGTDGSEHQLQEAPANVDGARFSYMEKAGKKFAVVRVQFGKDDVVLANERATQVRGGLARLGELDRHTLEAFYVRGQSLSEMSESFAAPIGTIKRRLHVARKRLARQLETASAV